jgi:hypothetical protein
VEVDLSSAERSKVVDLGDGASRFD